MKEQILALELRLLILRYGRRRIVDTLAVLGEQTPDEVDRELNAAMEQKADRSAKPKGRPISELVGNACRDRPEIVELVTALASRFENRSFLPHLREVVRFFDRTGVSHGRPKSRRESISKVVEALARLSRDELQQLAAPPSAGGDSDFALLAREIMAGGRPPRPPKDAAD